MRRVLTTLVGMVVVPAILSVSYAAERQPFVLDQKASEKLTPDAAKLCRQARKRLDRIDYVGALDFYVKAEAKDPDHVPLRFIIGDLALREARKRMGDESRDLLGKARKAFQEIVDLKKKGIPVRRAEVRRANEALKKIDELLASQEKRDQDRSRIGKQMVDNYMKEIETAKPTTDETKEKEGEQGKGPAGGRIGMRAVPMRQYGGDDSE